MITMSLKAVEVHDEILFVPGGMISRWVYGVASELHFFTEREAPMNKRPNKSAGEPPPGHLIASLESDVTQVGKVFSITENSRAYYTQYVIHGTGPVIYARGEGGRFASAGEGGGMYLPRNPGYGRARWRQRVRGQTANNFLGRGYDQTARVHPSLRGISME